MNTERPSDRTATPNTQYDFQRLERSVEVLLEEHVRLNAEREALLEELVDRQQRIAALESKLAAEGNRRVTAIDTIDQILERVDELESEVVAIGTSNGSGGR